MSEPTNGELAIMLGSLTEKFDGFCKQNEKDHEAVIIQTTKTNGSVAEAKRDIADLNKWRYIAIGSISAISVVLGWVAQVVIRRT
ncbi:MAG: hypothetical protein WC763_05205 [Candidatus Paceibacterota bacterium]|jgi:hypothetical protein